MPCSGEDGSRCSGSMLPDGGGHPGRPDGLLLSRVILPLEAETPQIRLDARAVLR